MLHELGSFVIPDLYVTLVGLLVRDIIEPTTNGNQKQNHARDDYGNEECVVGRYGAFEAGNLANVETLARVAVEEDVGVAEETENEVIHSRLIKVAVVGAVTLESCRALKALVRIVTVKKPGQVNTFIAATEKFAGNALAGDVRTKVTCHMTAMLLKLLKLARVQGTEKAFSLARPELKVTCRTVTLA